MFDRMALVELRLNTIDGHGTMVMSSANGSLLVERTLSPQQVLRIKGCLDSICDLGRTKANDYTWGMPVLEKVSPHDN